MLCLDVDFEKVSDLLDLVEVGVSHVYPLEGVGFLGGRRVLDIGHDELVVAGSAAELINRHHQPLTHSPACNRHQAVIFLRTRGHHAGRALREADL